MPSKPFKNIIIGTSKNFTEGGKLTHANIIIATFYMGIKVSGHINPLCL